MWLSWLRSIGTIERKKPIKFRRRAGQPVIVTDLNHPARLEKSTRLGDGNRGPNGLNCLTILRSPDRDGYLKNSGSNDGRGTQYKSATTGV
jgi:hypothetical protein